MMRILKLTGGFCYIVSFFLAASLFMNFNVGLSQGATLFIFLSLGALGFLLNLISYSRDKTGNPMSNLTYWLGSFFVFAGLVFYMLGLNYSKVLIIFGSVVLFISIFFLRRRKIMKGDNEILDQF
jgi:hypothetical protein